MLIRRRRNRLHTSIFKVHPGVEVGERHTRGLQIGQLRHQVVTLNVGHFEIDAGVTDDPAKRLGHARGIEAVGLDDDLDAALGAAPATCSNWVRKVRA
jgi:hypothetical protein